MGVTLSDFVRFVFTQYNDTTVAVLLMLLALFAFVFVIYWLHNKRRFNKLLHQIPASIVNNYLDSIIQNSQSLKSSLFRSDYNAIPSIVPVTQLQGAGVASGASAELLNQKNAEIASLQSSLSEKTSVVRELEDQLLKLQSSAGSGSGGGVDVAPYQKKIRELEDEVARLKEQLKNQGDKGELVEITKERDALKEKLQEYEIIEDDLANLKKLQEENENLKKQLAALQAGGAPKVDLAPPPPQTPSPPPPPPPVSEPVVAATEPPPSAPEPPKKEDDKSAEDLLSEFERMLG